MCALQSVFFKEKNDSPPVFSGLAVLIKSGHEQMNRIPKSDLTALKQVLLDTFESYVKHCFRVDILALPKSIGSFPIAISALV